MIGLDPADDPTAFRDCDQNTTVQEAAQSVEQAYDKSVDVLNDLVDYSWTLKANSYISKDQALAEMEGKIETMKSILEAENLKFHHMANAITSHDEVERLKSWKAMLDEEVQLAALKGDPDAAADVRGQNNELINLVIRQYGLAPVWRQVQEREQFDAALERNERQRQRRRY